MADKDTKISDIGCRDRASGGLVFPDFLGGTADYVAVRLLGCLLVRDFYDAEGKYEGRSAVRIVETEAYDENDQASHAYHGKSERNKALFGPAGHAYVYQIHGIHFCMNIACNDDGFGAGALIRAVEPVSGIGFMEERRGRKGYELTNGPAKLCKALDIDKALYGHDLSQEPLRLAYAELGKRERAAATVRIGISKEVSRLRRFVIAGNPYVSQFSWTEKNLHRLPKEAKV